MSERPTQNELDEANSSNAHKNVCNDKNCITHDEWYAKCNEIASLKAQLAEAQKVPSAINSCTSRAYEEAIGYVDGFNACRKLWLSAAPTYKKETES